MLVVEQAFAFCALARFSLVRYRLQNDLSVSCPGSASGTCGSANTTVSLLGVVSPSSSAMLFPAETNQSRLQWLTFVFCCFVWW